MPRFGLKFTDPAEDMLFGFSFIKSEAHLDGEVIGGGDIFSIGFFFVRLDIGFNLWINTE